MNRERPLIVNLEVTVPHLVLPIPSRAASEASDEGEQVRLVAVNEQNASVLAQHAQQLDVVGEATTSATYARQQKLFRLFSIKGVQAQGQALLLQILRHWKRKDQGQRGTGASSKHAIDELAFTVVVRQSNAPSEGTGKRLLPGLNQVVIFLDEEGIPSSYSIDETER